MVETVFSSVFLVHTDFHHQLLPVLSRYCALAEGSRPFLYICDAAAHLIYVFVTLDMVNSDKMIREMMLVVCSHPLFTNLYLQNVHAYGSF